MKFLLGIKENDMPALERAVDYWTSSAKIVNVQPLAHVHTDGGVLKVEIECDDASTAFYVGMTYAERRARGEN